MGDIVIRLYDYIKSHKGVTIAVSAVVTILLIVQLFRINYKEDISDFLPLDDKQQNALAVYQEISGANKLFVSFGNGAGDDADPDKIVDAINSFVDKLAERDTLGEITDIVSHIDYEQVSEVADFVYKNIPYFLEEQDYERIDSLLRQENYLRAQLEEDKQMLLFPMGGVRESSISYDPLNLFSPVFADLQTKISDVEYEIYDDCIFTSDLKRGIVMITSPYGSSETDKNPEFVELITSVAEDVEESCAGIDVQIIGGPVIAIGNSSQIKIDSIISVVISIVLISLLLMMTIKNMRNILLIGLTITWGMLFAVGVLSLITDEVSIIVIGISSVIIGIAVNYPLHIIAHLRHTTDMRSALRELVSPLVIGNITTVGAFLALVPLESIALRDLGLFSSFLLIGTILFSLVVLPHMCSAAAPKEHPKSTQGAPKEHSVCSQFFNKLSEVKVENKSWLVWVVVVLTLVFGYYSFQTKFDSNLSNINYMTEVQRGELERFEQMLTSAATEETLYLMTTSEDIDDALDANLRSRDNLRKMLEEGKITSHATASRFIVSQREQSRRLERWNRFVEGKALQLIENIKKTGAELGFVSGAFGDFGEILSKRYEPQEVSYFEPLTKTVFSNYICEDRERGRYSVIDIITTPIDKISECREEIQRNEEKAYCFDVKTLNSSVADSLSDNFNYIGYMCGCIVFVFLWFSFGRIELAILSFIPMAVSWVWILGIMAIFDIQFNIVNVILATFIFGQGDDYTIFMTEGACYEYTYRKKMLASYRHSIILSALIMFIGIGSLIVAKHPALHSLAEVTIVGMFSVVLMAYLFPPLIYKFLVETRDGRERLWPISLVNIFSKHRDELPIESNAEECLLLAKNRYRYKGIGIEREVSERVDRYGKEAREISKRGGTIVVINGGYGELAMLIALSNRQARVVSMDKDIEKIDVARYSTEKISNVEIRLLEVEKMELKAGEIYVLVEPREDEIEYFNKKCQFSCIEFENVVILRR